MDRAKGIQRLMSVGEIAVADVNENDPDESRKFDLSVSWWIVTGFLALLLVLLLVRRLYG